MVHLEGMLDGGEEIPAMKSIQEHVNGEFGNDYEGGIWGYVDVDLEDVPKDVMVRVNIAIPSRTLAKIDRQAKREGKTRSAFIAKAALECIAGRPIG